ncbi:MAG: hypothetical protein J0L67_18525 [Cytophagales bacterium]|nr:hypothetical protein [Cytophagales bacterium]
MKKFKWLLNWSLQNIYVNDGDVIPVRIYGKLIGQCKIIIEGDKVIGDFTLSEDLDNSQYVLYTISAPNLANQMFLEGILLVDYYDGLEKRAKKVEDMFS